VYGTAVALLAGSLLAWADPPANLDFSAGTLAGWEGEGFTLLKPPKGRETEGCAITSQEQGNVGKKALLHRAIVIPPGAGVIRFSAFAMRPVNTPANDNLDVVLMASGRRIIPKKVRKENGWDKTTGLLTRAAGGAPIYIWPVADYVGQTLRIALVDQDDRPGCYVYCTGFEIIPANIFDGDEFSQFMVKLAKEKNLPEMRLYHTQHFLGIGNADEDYCEDRLRDCETLYNAFYEHFRQRGFPVHQPENKLMVAIFDSQGGYEAYWNGRVPPLFVGLYDRQTNRFVTYDFGKSSSLLSRKKKAEEQVKQKSSDLSRLNNLETINRRTQEFRTLANIGTMMHETAHQISFNCGLLNRFGDVPAWLSEGLATYCESTKNGAWQGIGELDPERVGALVKYGKDPQQLIPLRSLLGRDEWRAPKDETRLRLGYAQSWALFRMLMEEQPKAMERYLQMIKPRQSKESRLADFADGFGDISAMQQRHLVYIKNLVASEPTAGKP
jgi:hypothetical protein